MIIFYEDKATGISAGVNDGGELFLGNESSGYNLPDTPRNRERIRRDFERYTQPSVAAKEGSEDGIG